MLEVLNVTIQHGGLKVLEFSFKSHGNKSHASQRRNKHDQNKLIKKSLKKGNDTMKLQNNADTSSFVVTCFGEKRVYPLKFDSSQNT